MSGWQQNHQAGEQPDSSDDTRAGARDRPLAAASGLRRRAAGSTALAVADGHGDRVGTATCGDCGARGVPLADDRRVDGGVGPARDTAIELAAARDAIAGELDQAERDLAATEEQLRQAQDRITALADEKAQTADEREVARQVAGSVVVVANQLEICVRGQSRLITALEDIESYDPTSVSAFAREVSTACTEALDGSKEIKRQLGIE